MADGAWTTVQYGRKRHNKYRGGQHGWGAPGRMDSAPPFPSSRGWGTVPYPNQRVPPPWVPRYAGPQVPSYAAALKGPPYQNKKRPPYQNRKAPAFTAPPTGGVGDVRRQPADPAFGRLVRKMHTLIKMVHHLQNVAPKPDRQEPKMISRMVHILTTMIKPATPTDHTMDLIKGNAENWGYNTLTILMDHYQTGLETILQELTGMLIPQWKSAFQVAVRWAKRNLPRLPQDVVDHAEAMITDRVSARGGQVAPQQAQVPPNPATAATRSSQQSPRGATSQKHPFQPNKNMAAATMTEPFEYKGEEVHSPIGEPPLERRDSASGSRRRTRGVVLNEVNRLPPNNDDSDPSDWRVTEAPAKEPTHRQSMTLIEDEDEEEEGQGQEVAEPEIQDHDVSAETPRPPNRTSIVTTAHVHRQYLDSDEELFDESSQHLTASTPQRKFQVHRHINTQRKLTDWNLAVHRKRLIIGDSNLCRLPDYTDADLQIDCFPGGHFRHAQALMEKTCPPSDVTVELIVLAFGLNSRANKSKETTVKNVQGAIRSTKKRFPYAKIWIPLVNFSTELPQEEQENLHTLNEYLERNQNYIPLLPEDEFSTETDDVHWTTHTGEAMFQHWMSALNLTSL
ncbi:uncharacterized protein LOC144462221 [Epinephelus lanceolatus]